MKINKVFFVVSELKKAYSFSIILYYIIETFVKLTGMCGSLTILEVNFVCITQSEKILNCLFLITSKSRQEKKQDTEKYKI